MTLLALLLACQAPESDTSGLPPWADAVVLAATLAPDQVTVHGTILSTQHVDLDAPDDARDGFRYQILDGSDEVLYERSTQGPILVDAFLDFWGGTAGIDVLAALPTLGRFAIHVPLLDGGETVRFQIRDAEGAYGTVGRYDLANTEADDLGVRPVEGFATLHEGGPSNNRLDLVIVGDGFPEDELDRFHTKADRAVTALLETEPFATYADRLNIHRVDVFSNEAGASFDCPTCGTRDTAFGSIFPVEVINRFTGSNYDSRALIQAQQWEVARAVSVVPWDMVLVIVNTDRPAGMAVHYATASTNNPFYAETVVHELGHSIGLLGDEYVADFCIRDARLGLPVNIAEDASDVPWAHWIEPGTELPTPNNAGQGVIGAFPSAFNCPELFRPRRNCLMNSGSNFCAVCTEQLVRRFHRYSDPVDTVHRDGNEAWVESAHPLTASWMRDGEVFATSGSGERVTVGKKPFEVSVQLDAPEVRVRREDLSQVY